MIDVIIIGGEGDGSNIADFLGECKTQTGQKLNFIGFLNDRVPPGGSIDGHEVLGSLKDCDKFKRKGIKFISVLVRINGMKKRHEIIENLGLEGRDFTEAIHSSSYVAKTSSIGNGSVIYPRATILSNTTIGEKVLVLAQSNVGHHTILRGYNKIAPGAIVGSRIDVGIGAQIGTNATIVENLKIGKYSVLGSGAVLTKDIPDNEVWFGNPAKFFRKVI